MESTASKSRMIAQMLAARERRAGLSRGTSASLAFEVMGRWQQT
jgi:hypothetical protein